MRMTDRQVIQEAIEIVVIQELKRMIIIGMIIIGRMAIIDMTEMTHTQEIIEDLVTAEAETAHTQEELRTDLGTIREITLDHPVIEITLAVNHPVIEITLTVDHPVIEITLDHPETEIKYPIPEDVIGDIQTKDLSLEKEEAGTEVGKTVETIIGGQKIADLPTETMKEMEGVREDTLQDLHCLHHIEIGSQKSLL